MATTMNVSDPGFNEGRCWIAIGALFAGLAVACGALAAHRLDRQFAAQYAGETRVVGGETIPRAVKYLADFRTAAENQMYHGLGLVTVGLLLDRIGQTRRGLVLAAWAFLVGIVLFSGSLYLLTLTGITWLGAITPIGGVAFLIGWGALTVSAWR